MKGTPHGPTYYYYYCSQYMDVSETWWMRYIESSDMRLGINESLGGSKVAWWEGEPSGFNSKQCMAAGERIERLDDNGTYQGPYPQRDGWLIGVSSNLNPRQNYQYELLILDCNKYVAGDPHPWIYGTSPKQLASGRTFWTTWTPPHSGYYWTYFRIYDENGTLLEDQCYGALF